MTLTGGFFRKHRMTAKWMHIFMLRGLSVKHLECLPEHSTGRKRKDEILDWYNQHTHNDPFVIIDDDKSLHELPTSLNERWIETSPYIGLTPELVQGIIKS
jgi:hypothetical protein